MTDEPASFTEFWPIYLAAHMRFATRAVHYCGTVLGVLILICFVAGGGWWALIAAPVAGYGPAWAAHLLIEHNRPATFRHPVWSFIGDFRMLYFAATGRLGGEYARAGLH
jgi:hypothetical protein